MLCLNIYQTLFWNLTIFGEMFTCYSTEDDQHKHPCEAGSYSFLENSLIVPQYRPLVTHADVDF